MIKYHSPKEILEAARSTESTAEELDRLLEYGYSFVDEAVAGNENTSIETLRKLIQFSTVSILASNPNSDIEIIQELIRIMPRKIDTGRGNHKVFQAWIQICLNDKTPIHEIVGLLNAPDTSVEFRKVLARESTRADVLSTLFEDRSERVRRKASDRLSQLQEQKGNPIQVKKI